MCVHCYPDQLLVFLPRAGLRGSAACWRQNTSLALQHVQVFDFPSWTISSFSFLYLTFPALLPLLQRLPDPALARWQVRQTPNPVQSKLPASLIVVLGRPDCTGFSCCPCSLLSLPGRQISTPDLPRKSEWGILWSGGICNTYIKL